MKYWTEFYGYIPDIRGKKKKFDNTIFSFDIETTSFFILDNKQYNINKYLNLDKKNQEECIFMSNMYIWMFSINEDVYFGRTWDEFYSFLLRLENWGTFEKKFVFVHNLSYEFEFLRNRFKFKNVFSRKSRKVLKCELEDFNIEFRCSYMMSRCLT